MPKPKITFEALGTVWLVETLERVEIDLEALVLPVVRTFESRYSRFDPGSIVGTLNREKRLDNPSDELKDMLSFAQEMYRVSGGVFNISVTASLTRLGYGKGAADTLINNADDMGVALSGVDVRLEPKTEIDFGGFGKGWLIDELSTLLRDNDVSQYVINGGGDIYVSSDEPIELALEHPTNSSQMIGTTRISHGALAVSSPYKRSWKVGGATKHHIIDSRTGEPVVNDVASVYVKASSARLADVMATVIMIDPSQLDRLKADYDLEVIIIRQSQLD